MIWKKLTCIYNPPPCIPFPSILHPPTLPSPPSMTASFVAKLVLFHLNKKKKVVNFSIFWFYIPSIYIWIVVHIYIYIYIYNNCANCLVLIFKIYNNSDSKVRRLYPWDVFTSPTFAPVRCLYQCDICTSPMFVPVRRLNRPTFVSSDVCTCSK